MAYYNRSQPNCQTLRSEFKSELTGGPSTIAFPVFDVIVCGDSPTTGDITYALTDYTQVAGKKITFIKNLDTTATGNSILITLPAGYTFTESGTTSYTLPDIPTTIDLTFPQTSTVVGTDVSATSGGSAAVTIYNGNGALTGARTVDCNGNSLTINNASSMTLRTTGGGTFGIASDSGNLSVVSISGDATFQAFSGKVEIIGGDTVEIGRLSTNGVKVYCATGLKLAGLPASTTFSDAIVVTDISTGDSAQMQFKSGFNYSQMLSFDPTNRFFSHVDVPGFRAALTSNRSIVAPTPNIIFTLFESTSPGNYNSGMLNESLGGISVSIAGHYEVSGQVTVSKTAGGDPDYDGSLNFYNTSTNNVMMSSRYHQADTNLLTVSFSQVLYLDSDLFNFSLTTPFGSGANVTIYGPLNDGGSYGATAVIPGSYFSMRLLK